MLAMKCMSARVDTKDADDIRFLISFLGLKAPMEVFTIVEQFYPANRISIKTQLFVEELMSDLLSRK